MVGKPSPGWYFVQLVTGEVIQVHHSDLHAPAAQKQSLSSSVHIGKKPAPKNASKVASETAKDVKRHSPVNSEASTSTPSCPPLPKTVLGYVQ